ncbi:MAG TPA: DUF1361 domain-containing protein [Gaiellaceae bacterium]|nr:DUF1361 domain-containing protein [Gaiellaceae bacterium]
MRARVWLPVAALFAASAWCIVLVVARRHAYGPGGLRYLVWNLGLAWLPLVFALLLYAAYRRRHTAAELVALGAAWLVFLPNAPYMLTDFIHLGDRHRLVDTLIFSSFAFTALALGFASMLLVQIVVTRTAGAATGWGVASGALFLASLGVYLGRVHRFNSWDVLTRPRLVAWTMWQGLDNPLAHVDILLFVAAGGGFLMLAYVGLYGVADLVSALGGDDQHPVLLSNRQWPSRSSSSNPS